MASGYRPENYRALHSGAPDKIHILAIDYRGFDVSTGVPSRRGLLVDAVSVFDWATKAARIPLERIVIFGHTEKRFIRQDILKHGVQNKILSYPIVGMAVLRAF